MARKILIVDDSKLNVKLLTDILVGEGYEIAFLENGSKVLETVHAIKPDIVLLDVIMPGIDGFEVCRQLKRDFEIKDIPIIMLTAKTEGSDIRKALELGAFDYIKKPIDVAEVIARVQSALRYKYKLDELKEMAMKDGLTGLYNHTLLIELFEKEYVKQCRDASCLSFAMIDIDYFKKVNDTYGHMAGDMILKQLAGILTESVRRSDRIPQTFLPFRNISLTHFMSPSNPQTAFMALHTPTQAAMVSRTPCSAERFGRSSTLR